MPVYSVADEKEAEALLVMACPMDRHSGKYYAPELAREQTLENLDAFSDRLDLMHDIIVKTGRCRCTPKE